MLLYGPHEPLDKSNAPLARICFSCANDSDIFVVHRATIITKTIKTMKQLSTLLLSCLAAGAVHAATVSGTVLNAGTGAPINGQVVSVKDSGSTFTLTGTTNSSGYYTITLPATLPMGMPLTVQASGCGSAVAYFNNYAGTSFTTNIFMCSNSSPRLNGTVWLGANIANTGAAKVYFIEKKYDPVIMDTTLTAIDSVNTSSTGAYSKVFTSMPAGAILIKAALLPAHPNYANYLPTYSTQSFSWTGAKPVSSSSFTNSYAVNDIIMISGTNPGGAGFIGGSVLLGANKSAAVGDPLSSRILILTSTTGQATAYAYSDASGKFQFPNLPIGTYKLFGDALGKSNPQLTVTLTNTNKNINNIIFEENSKKFEGRFSNVGVNETAGAFSQVNLYPNPAKELVRFSGLSKVSGEKTVVLSDITGSVISRQSFADGKEVMIATGSLASGIYLVQLQTAVGTTSFRMAK